MQRPNNGKRKTRQLTATVRQRLRETRSSRDQLHALDRRPGDAKRERDKLYVEDPY